MAARHRVSRRGLSRSLIEWYERAHRDLPWRRTSDPYRVWVSEVMLQQTRAQAVIPFYERFLERFPNIDALAAAAEDEVLTLWSGLGYYSRARLLLKAAQRVAAAGGFPRDYDAIRSLPGIGDYTAAAISSIAFQLPRAVVDGNVLRVVARVERDAADIGSARTRARFRDIVEGWLDRRRPGLFNQALMELGATVCLPRKPLCSLCPVREDCGALREGTVSELPVKLRKTAPVEIEGVLLIVRNGGRTLLRRRGSEVSRMSGFWDLPTPADLPGARIGRSFGEFRHTITHHHYTFTVLAARARRRGAGDFRWFEAGDCAKFPISTIARKALRLAGIL